MFDLPDHRKDNIKTGLARIFMIYCCDCDTLFLAYCFFASFVKLSVRQISLMQIFMQMQCKAINPHRLALR